MRTQKLRETRDTKKEQLQKYQEESKEQREGRENEIQSLRATIGEENVSKENDMRRLNEISRQNHEQLESMHKDEVTALNKRINTLEAQLKEVKTKNKTEELKMREEYKKADRLFTENLGNYDAEMKDQTSKKEQA